jgi:hypothetical protein
MNMDGDDAQLVDSILREYGSQPSQQQQVPMMNSIPPASLMSGFDTAPPSMNPMEIQSTPIVTPQQQHQQQNIVVGYKQPNQFWKNFKMPILVLSICYIVFNPFIYYYLLKLAPTIFAANTSLKMQLRVFILSLIVAVLFSITLKYV